MTSLNTVDEWRRREYAGGVSAKIGTVSVKRRAADTISGMEREQRNMIVCCSDECVAVIGARSPIMITDHSAAAVSRVPTQPSIHNGECHAS